MVLNDILCVIINYKNDYNAKTLYSEISKYIDTFILDTFHKDNNITYEGTERIMELPNIMYGGAFFVGANICESYNKKFLLEITSDVLINTENINKFINILQNEDFSNIGSYQISADKGSMCYGLTSWQGIGQEIYNQKTNGVRKISQTEGWFQLVNYEMLKEVFKSHSDAKNFYGWGIDECICKLSIKKGLNVVVDDRVIAYHPHGTSYNNISALNMWMENKENIYKELGLEYGKL